MKKLTVILLLASVTHTTFAQDWPLKKMVEDKMAQKVVFSNLAAFSFAGDKKLSGRGIYQHLKLNPSFSGQLLAERPEAIHLSLPVGGNKTISCDLVKFSLGNIKFTENNTGIIHDPKIPVTYRGVVNGEVKKNTVTLTVNDEYLALEINMADKVLKVTQAGETDKNDYRLYNSSKIKFPVIDFDCGTTGNSLPRTESGIDLTGGTTPTAVQDKCVNVFVDCSDSVFLWRSSNRQSVINYVYELFNSVTTGYYNDSVNVQLTTINVWTTASPYRATTRETALSQVAAYWQDNFWGNICVGLDYSINATPGRAGLAGDIGRVKAVSANTCPAYTSTKSACCYNDLDYNVTVQSFPTGPNTTQQQVYLVMHEMGHLLGAYHTKWCGWKLTSNPDTFGAIDSCGAVEGTCAQGPPPPANGATIMSYCVTSNTNGNFVSYNNGFGRLPGAAIRNFIDQSACILLCVDCFGFSNNIENDNTAYAYDPGKGPVISEVATIRNGHPLPGSTGSENGFLISQNAKQ